ncbi:MAG: hypothetical protein QM662_08530 [Gordonia sp. (in: high G+C Gram-positive bacteria)]
MKKFQITITGNTPLLMHNSRLSDPLDPASKALKKISSKRTKTDDDHIALGEAEFMGSLYLDPHVGPFIPDLNIAAALLAGAKLNKLGVKVTRGLLITTPVNPLAYDGPRDPAEMWRSGRFAHRASVGVGQSRVMRTRPVFHDWACEAEGLLDESQLDISQIIQIAQNAGDFIGIGDWRPRFGRFTAKVEAE